MWRVSAHCARGQAFRESGSVGQRRDFRGSGALDAPDGLSGGFSKFLHLFNDSSNDHQVRGPYPKYIGGVPNQSEVNAIRPAYFLLEKYQELLVDKGLLAE